MEQQNYQGRLQRPIGSGFDRTSTSADIMRGVDLRGKIAIVTGGHSGLGLETTKALAAAGATVIVAARDIAKAKKNLAGVSGVEVESLELTDPVSIGAFAAKFLASARPLHLLFNNAGIMWGPLLRDNRGYESQFATNHLGHFHLTAQVWPALKAARGARVINTSSWGHHASSIVFDDVNFDARDYDPMLAYGQSKTANILFAMELDARGAAFGVRSFSLHPGLILTTDLGRSITPETKKRLGMIDAQGQPVQRDYTGAKDIQQGISTQLWCATSALLEGMGGVYCENNDIAELDIHYDPSAAWVNDIAAITGVMPYALDAASATRLWTLSENLTDLVFAVV